MKTRFYTLRYWKIIKIIVIIYVNRFRTPESCPVRTQSWRCYWSFHLVFGLPTSFLPFGWYSNAILCIRECSILLICCSHFFSSSEFHLLCVLLLVFLELLYCFDGVSYKSDIRIPLDKVQNRELILCTSNICLSVNIIRIYPVVINIFVRLNHCSLTASKTAITFLF
jgi:hypothetical protein